MSRRYLVTGAQGFVGRYLVSLLLQRSADTEILGLGRSARSAHFLHSLSCGGHPFAVPLPQEVCLSHSERYRYHAVDLAHQDIGRMISEFAPTHVVHLAASLRGTSDEEVLRNNRESTACLLNSLPTAGTGMQMVLLASSAGVYGNRKLQPLHEALPPAPVDAYSKSKLQVEQLALAFGVKSGIPVAIARIFNILGPGQDELHVAGRFTAQVGTILGHHVEPAITTGALAQTRDFLDVRDVAGALVALLDQNRDGICNIGSGVETKIADLLGFFLSPAKLLPKVRVDEQCLNPPSIQRSVADTSRLKECGFVPSHRMEVSCAEMLAYHRRFVHSQCAG